MMKLTALLPLLIFSTLLSASTWANPHQPLQIIVYNPGENSTFPVSSTLVSGKKHAILIDTQFEKKDAEALIKIIKKSGKKLTTIYISHGDPDYYFGLDTLLKAYPKVKVVATPQTVDHIVATQQAKLTYWGPLMRDQAPQKLVTPQKLEKDTLKLENERLEIKALTSPAQEYSYVWIPSIKTALGGALTYNNIHVWTADTQTKESRKQWVNTLDHMQALQPQNVVPGHYIGQRPTGDAAIKFTRDYLVRYEKVLDTSTSSTEVVSQMEQAYPGLPDTESLELGAKVNKGEMKWK